MTRIRTSKELILVGDHAAEVDIELQYSDESWPPAI
jgi:hypothetical protein